MSRRTWSSRKMSSSSSSSSCSSNMQQQQQQQQQHAGVCLVPVCLGHYTCCTLRCLSPSALQSKWMEATDNAVVVVAVDETAILLHPLYL